jgi:hypothetical protein
MYDNPNSFVSEGATWNRINKDYDFLCVNVIHRKYWFSEDRLIYQKKSQLKIEKINYYTSFFQLNNASIRDVINKRYYHNLAFNYTKALFYYRDKENSLKGLELFVVAFIFVCLIPIRALLKLNNKIIFFN